MPGIHFREVVCMLGIFGLFLQAAAGHILYLALHLESGSFPRPLPPDREHAAFADLQKGGAAAAQARDTLIRHNLRLVAHICKKYYAGNSAQDDMISIGTIGLIKAVDTFDPAKGKRFASYASRCIENELRMDLRRGRRTGVTLSLQEPLEADGQLTLADTLPGGGHYVNSVLIGYAPADDPQIAMAVVLEYGGGGSNAAPILRAVLDAVFGG
jgi:RNA polymerase sporulation-specific sigma factor